MGGALTRSRVSIPILQGMEADFFSVFDKVAVIEKERQVFVRGDIILTLDKIDGLGEYISNLIDKKIEIKVNKEFLDQFKVENTTKKLIQYFSNIIK